MDVVCVGALFVVRGGTGGKAVTAAAAATATGTLCGRALHCAHVCRPVPSGSAGARHTAAPPPPRPTPHAPPASSTHNTGRGGPEAIFNVILRAFLH